MEFIWLNEELYMVGILPPQNPEITPQNPEITPQNPETIFQNNLLYYINIWINNIRIIARTGS